MDNQVGINKDAIQKLCLEIQDYSDKVKIKLNQIGDKWYEAKPYFEGNGVVEFQNKFSKLEDSFETISNNILSYIDDFNTLISKYESLDTSLSKQVKINAENIESEER